MNDEPILELPPILGERKEPASVVEDPFLSLELPPMAAKPTGGSSEPRFELPPEFELPVADPDPLETESGPVVENPGVDEVHASPLPRPEAVGGGLDFNEPIPVTLDHPLNAQPVETEPLVAFVSELRQTAGVEPVVATPETPVELGETFVADSEGPLNVEPAEIPVESPPFLPAPDGSLERLVESLESDIPAEAENPRETGGERFRDSRAGVRYLHLGLGEKGFLVEAAAVKEIGLVPTTTYLPQTPHWMRGLTNLRGEILSVVDLRRLLGFPEAVPDPFLNRMVIVETGSGDLRTGLVVDRVEGFVRIPDGGLRPLNATADDAIGDYLVGVHFLANRVLAVLDLEALLNSEAIRCFEPA